MNAVDMAKRAYGANATPVRTPRNTEYAVYARITKRIQSASSARSEDFIAHAHALHENRRHWPTLVVDDADKNNGLPDALRALIVYLQKFVNLHSGKVLRGKASSAPIVEINTAVMRGLGKEATLG